MLTMTDQQMAAFDKQRLHRIDPKIDRWLASQHAAWASMPLDQRKSVVGSMVDWADAAGMKAETDYALYCDLMVRIGPGWPQFAGSAAAQEIVGEADDTPPVKLEALTELAMQRAEGEAV